MAKDEDDKTRISVILPRETHQKLLVLAKSERRSGNGVIVNAIEERHADLVKTTTN